MCSMVSMETLTVAKYTCNYICDVTNAATLVIKILSGTLASGLPAVCEIEA